MSTLSVQKKVDNYKRIAWMRATIVACEESIQKIMEVMYDKYQNPDKMIRWLMGKIIYLETKIDAIREINR